MRIFALETDVEKLTKSFLTAGEQQLLSVRFHGFLFFFKFLKALFYTALLAGCVALAWEANLPVFGIIVIALVVWFYFVFLRALTAFIDWKFDVLVLTTEKLVVINQSSLFKREIRQMNLENLASVSCGTQFGNIFPFGVVCFDLKEGVGQRLCLKFIPDAAKVTSRISETLTGYERRNDVRS